MCMFSRSTILLAAASAAVGIGLGLGGPAVHANTILLQDTFGATSIANPPWTTTTTTSGGTIGENGALDVGLGSAPTSSTTAYVSASDGEASQTHGTTVNFDVQGTFNFSGLTNGAPNSTSGTDSVGLLQVNPSLGLSIGTATLLYNPSNGYYEAQFHDDADYTTAQYPGAVKLFLKASLSTYASETWNLNITYTNNGSGSWTANDTLTVTSGSTTLATLSAIPITKTGVASGFNPINNSNTVQVGDVAYGVPTNDTPYLSGSYTVSNFSDTLVGGSSIPEPATLALMAAMGTGLLLVGRKRKVA